MIRSAREGATARRLAAGVRRHARLLATSALPALLLLGLGLGAPAEAAAAFPGANGLIAFESHRRGANSDIHVMNPDGSGRRRLTHGPASDHTPAGSPDGRRVAFERRRGNISEIYVVDVDGAHLRRLTDSRDTLIDVPASSRMPAWSADGGRILFVSNRDGDNVIYSINADGGGRRRLLGGYEPAASPDGGRLAFSSIGGAQSTILVASAAGRGRRRISPNLNVGAPNWSPDAGRITFSGITGDEDNEEVHIYVMRSNGSGPARLTSSPLADDAPAWSPDGARIVFSREEGFDENSDLMIMNAKGGGIRPLTRTSADRESEPDWLPAPVAPRRAPRG
jgi:TolB protein